MNSDQDEGVFFAAICFVGFSAWTIYLNWDGFTWWSLLTGIIAVVALPRMIVLWLKTSKKAEEKAEAPGRPGSKRGVSMFLSEWILQLNSPDPEVRDRAISLSCNSFGLDAIPFLIDLLDDPFVGKHAAVECSNLRDHEVEAAIPALLNALKQPSPVARRHAIDGLLSIVVIANRGEVFDPKTCRNITRNWTDKVVGALIEAINNVLVSKEEWIRGRSWIKEDEGYVLDAAAHMLGELGASARAAVPALIHAFRNDSRFQVSPNWVRHALKKIDPVAATKAGLG